LCSQRPFAIAYGNRTSTGIGKLFGCDERTVRNHEKFYHLVNRLGDKPIDDLYKIRTAVLQGRIMLTRPLADKLLQLGAGNPGVQELVRQLEAHEDRISANRVCELLGVTRAKKTPYKQCASYLSRLTNLSNQLDANEIADLWNAMQQVSLKLQPSPLSCQTETLDNTDGTSSEDHGGQS
jgi:hypothetical protein